MLTSMPVLPNITFFKSKTSVRNRVVYSIIREKWQKGKALADFSESLGFVILWDAVPNPAHFLKKVRQKLYLPSARQNQMVSKNFLLFSMATVVASFAGPPTTFLACAHSFTLMAA